MGIDELPQQIASQVEAAIDSTNNSTAEKMHEEEINLERARLKTEERIVERQAERDETIAATQSGVDELRSMFSSLMSRLDSIMTSNTPIINTEINAPDESDEDENDEDENELPAVASEDKPDESPELLSQNAIENDVEKPVEAVENAESEIVNGPIVRRGRKRRRR